MHHVLERPGADRTGPMRCERSRATSSGGSVKDKHSRAAMRPLVHSLLSLTRPDLVLAALALALLLPLCLLPPGHCSSDQDQVARGLVHIFNKNITAFNNRNLTIECHVDLTNRSDEKPSFSTNGRMVLTFMTIPREIKPLHQMQSFLHCIDPGRTQCRAQFNLDLACLEDQMNASYYLNRARYRVEAACQVDDAEVCSSSWMARHPYDCFDLGQVMVIQAPKLNQACLYRELENRTLDCGENQYCNTEYGVCLCQKAYTVMNRRCVPREDHEPLVPENTSLPSFPFESTKTPVQVNEADSKGTFKAIVIFLLVVAILLCITLGIVIIWSRHYRHLLHEVSSI